MTTTPEPTTPGVPVWIDPSCGLEIVCMCTRRSTVHASMPLTIEQWNRLPVPAGWRWQPDRLMGCAPAFRGLCDHCQADPEVRVAVVPDGTELGLTVSCTCTATTTVHAITVTHFGELPLVDGWEWVAGELPGCGVAVRAMCDRCVRDLKLMNMQGYHDRHGEALDVIFDEPGPGGQVGRKRK